jgi:hypothetical protein
MWADRHLIYECSIGLCKQATLIHWPYSGSPLADSSIVAADCIHTGYDIAKRTQVTKKQPAIQPYIVQRYVDAAINVGQHMEVKE